MLHSDEEEDGMGPERKATFLYKLGGAIHFHVGVFRETPWPWLGRLVYFLNLLCVRCVRDLGELIHSMSLRHTWTFEDIATRGTNVAQPKELIGEEADWRSPKQDWLQRSQRSHSILGTKF